MAKKAAKKAKKTKGSAKSSGEAKWRAANKGNISGWESEETWKEVRNR